MLATKQEFIDRYGYTMTVAQTAEVLGVSLLTVSVGIKQGMFDFGMAYKRNPNQKNSRYKIYTAKLCDYIGIS